MCTHTGGAAIPSTAAPVHPVTQTVRQGFVRKVLGLLAVQLIITTAIGGLIVFSPSAKGFVAANPWVGAGR